MVVNVLELKIDDITPDISHIITEDDEPVDNIPSSKQQRFFVSPLYDSNVLKRPFLADVNIGIFYTPKGTPIVPDMFLSLNVEPAKDWWEKKNRSYFVWEFGKPPDVVVEIVSNFEGDELGGKKKKYASMGIHYYVVYDPQLLIQDKELQVYENYVGEFLPRPDHRLPRIGLSLTLWEGVFEERFDRWLRWCDAEGNLLHTGTEQAGKERQRTEQERQRAQEAQQRADQEQQRAQEAQQRVDLLAAKLRELGIDPGKL